MNASNPFAKPLLAENGNTSQEELYTAVGRALDKWEWCETRFTVLYISLAKPKGGHQQILRSFGAITASSTRREMISAACDAYFAWIATPESGSGSIQEEMQKVLLAGAALREKIRLLLKLHNDASARRNEIAHGTTRKIESWYLIPGLFASRKTSIDWTDVKYRMSSVEIIKLSELFDTLGMDALNLASELGRFHNSLPEKKKQALS